MSTLMWYTLTLTYKDFEAAIIKMLQEVIVNMIEINEKNRKPQKIEANEKFGTEKYSNQNTKFTGNSTSEQNMKSVNLKVEHSSKLFSLTTKRLKKKQPQGLHGL